MQEVIEKMHKLTDVGPDMYGTALSQDAWLDDLAGGDICSCP